MEYVLQQILDLHNKIREAVVTACETAVLEEMSAIAQEEAGDTIYAIDRVSEALLVAHFSQTIAQQTPIMLIAEGLAGGEQVLPPGTPPEQARWRIIVDPIDGTRGLMYQKRSGWILTGVAPTKGQRPACKTSCWRFRRKFRW